MCRFLVYKGKQILLSKLLTEPKHSLIKQSYCAKERKEPLNGDGFGVGWYVGDLNEEACLFTSITPAWANRNLHRMVEKLQSDLVFAHVRAATEGLPVTELNCHPFQRGKFLWMHNGAIPQFAKIKRKVRRALSDELYNWVQGSTDSEHAFALMHNYLPGSLEDSKLEDWKPAMLSTIQQLEEWTREAGITEPLSCNFSITDGRSILCCRYISDASEHAESLYYVTGTEFRCEGGKGFMMHDDGTANAVIVASEPTTADASYWRAVPPNHFVEITEDCKVTINPFP